jgi:hypothetical protein
MGRLEIIRSAAKPASTLYFNLNLQVVHMVLESDLGTFLASCDSPPVPSFEENLAERNKRPRERNQSCLVESYCKW